MCREPKRKGYGERLYPTISLSVNEMNKKNGPAIQRHGNHDGPEHLSLEDLQAKLKTSRDGLSQAEALTVPPSRPSPPARLRPDPQEGAHGLG